MIGATTVFSAVLLGSLGAVNLLAPFLQPSSREARRGLAAYRDGEWADAQAAWLAAREGAKDTGAVDFNAGAAAYRNGDLKTALERFSVSGRSPLPPEGAAEYNLGNTLFRGQKLEEALKAYRAALRANPDDADARYNYELTLRKLEDAPPDSSRSDSGEKNQEQNQNQQEPSKPEAGKQDEAKDPSGREDQAKNEEQPPPEGSPPPEPPPAGERKPGQVLSKEEAERLLNAVTPEERELLEARLRAATRRKTEKDW